MRNNRYLNISFLAPRGSLIHVQLIGCFGIQNASSKNTLCFVKKEHNTYIFSKTGNTEIER